MPPRDVYIEPFPGGGAIRKRKPPAIRDIGIDLDLRALEGFDGDGTVALLTLPKSLQVDNHAAVRLVRLRARPSGSAGSDHGGGGRVMATVNGRSLRKEPDDARARIAELRQGQRQGRRVLHDIVFEVVAHRVDAEVRECPGCRARTRGRFPDDMPGPRQYGTGLQAFVVNLLSLRRAVAPVHAISALRLSEATCLGYGRRLDDALMPWEAVAVAHLLERPALHADETGFRVDGIGIIPRHRGVLVHDRCRHSRAALVFSANAPLSSSPAASAGRA